MHMRVCGDTGEILPVKVNLIIAKKGAMEDFVMISSEAAWYLGVKHLTQLEYRVLFACIGCAQFGGKVQCDKSQLASMLAADRASVSRAVKRLVEKGVLIDEGERFGNMAYYRLNRALLVKGKLTKADMDADYKLLRSVSE